MQMQRKVQLRAEKKKRKRKRNEKKRKISTFQVKVRLFLESGRSRKLETLLTKVAQTAESRGGRDVRKVSRALIGSGDARGRSYHAMRHVRVTSRGRSREHRVLSVTCPVTRSPLPHPLSTGLLLPPPQDFIAGRWFSFLVAPMLLLSNAVHIVYMYECTCRFYHVSHCKSIDYAPNSRRSPFPPLPSTF